MLIPLFALLLSASAAAVNLQDVYHQAGPGEGYDKLLSLDPAEIYTGSLIVDIGTSCALHGHGALIALDAGGSIKVGQSIPSHTKLDIDGCVITGGARAIDYEWADDSRVTNCTIVGNGIGIRMWGTDGVIENCIIAGNDEYGIACRDNMYPAISHNCMWGNLGGDCMKYCFT
jgi:parallel beta-helix repeat protein